MSNKYKTLFKTTFVASVLVVAGCGYSDYPGHPGHRTDNEAYLPSLSTVIAGFGDEYDGTYVYSTKYNHQRWMKDNFEFKVILNSYKNVVGDSYPHRTNVFPDADGFERATGFSGGIFHKYWTAVDRDPDVEGGLDNFIQTHPLDANGEWIEPGIIFVITEPEQEVDSVDWDLQSTVKSASSILTSLISNGGKIDDLELSVNAIELNNQKHQVEPFMLKFSSTGGGNNQISLKNQPATKSVINAILKNTQDLKKVDLKIHFNNGMVIALPKKLSIMFNHSVLAKFAK